MKKLLLAGIAVLFLATGAVSTPAHSESGSTLLQACEALEREIRISGDDVQLPARPDVHKCWGYMAAFSNIFRDQLGHARENIHAHSDSSRCSLDALR